MTTKAKVAERLTTDDLIMILTANPTAGSATVHYEFTAFGNQGGVGNIVDITVGDITLASGKDIDYETTKSIVFIVT
ncbi:hypothetical protein DPMN_151637 [Dreissena polymorpha]|uniref:Uncharacterized protein n=1 Tax=Dreissena polymorpha TaxID=45954 RepID=A0A9D4FLK9_DREPO|nr:hypothetical protein DPMN_151637 [Dreissena polymorpha]